jgi:hypothetical protein
MSTVDTSTGAPPARTVLVVGDDARAADAVRLAFERDGFAVVAGAPGDAAVDDAVGLIVASGTGEVPAREAIERVVKGRTKGGRDVPVLYVGNGISRREAMSAGADEVIGRPAYARDVVTIGRLLADQPAEVRGHWIGQIAETVGVYYLVRALASLGRSGVLTLSRGLRRGEVRYFLGEVTSAQVGGLHGQAALHQLLLWTDGRFDFRREDVVRRRQIPLPPDELFADAERFLQSVREVSGGLSPAMVLEQDPRQMLNQGKSVPTEVHGVLRMFDGNRTLADVIEDSPYRVFETMRVAATAVQAGILRRVHVERPRATFRAVLALEEWLAGGSKEAVVERVASLGDSGTTNPVVPAVGTEPGTATEEVPRLGPSGKRKRRKAGSRGGGDGGRPTTAPPMVAAPPIDWGALVPRGVAVEMQGLAQVVPSSQVSGEIAIPRELSDAPPATRKVLREGLEALTSSEARDKLFPADPPAPREAPPMVAKLAEPSAGPVEAVPQAITSTGVTPVGVMLPAASESRMTVRVAVPPMPPSVAASGETVPVIAPAAPVLPERPAILNTPPPAAEVSETEVTSPVTRIGQPRAAREPTDVEAEWAELEREASSRYVAAKADAPLDAGEAAEWARLEAEAKVRAAADEAAEAAEWERVEHDARARLAADAPGVTREDRVRAEIQAAAEARIAAAVGVADALDLTPVTSPPFAGGDVHPTEKMGQLSPDPAAGSTTQMPADQARRLQHEASHAGVTAEIPRDAAARLAEESAAGSTARLVIESGPVGPTAEIPAVVADHLRADSKDGDPPVEEIILPPPPGEATPEERAEVERAARRARNVSAQTRAEAAAAAEALANAERVRAMAEQLSAEADAAEARHRAAEAARTAELASRKEASTSGVVGGTLPSARRTPSTPPPEPAGPSILVDDLVAAQQAVAAVVPAQHATPPSTDARTPAAEAQVAEVRGAVQSKVTHAGPHFDDHEEEFFEKGSTPGGHAPEHHEHETFQDLDEGYQPVGFWDRLLGRDKPGRGKKPTR